MKKLFSLAFAAFLCVSLAMAQQSETRSLESFTGVSVGSAIKAELQKGNDNSIYIETSGIQPDRVATIMDGNTLKVQVDGNNWKRKSKGTIKVVITYTEKLSAVAATSSAKVTCLDILDGQALSAMATSSGQLEFTANVNKLAVSATSSGDVVMNAQASDAALQVTSSGTIKGNVEASNGSMSATSGASMALEGNIDNVSVQATSGAGIKGYDLVAQSATCSATSGASIKLTVQDAMTGRATSGATVYYKGNPAKKQAKTNSGGTIKNVN